VCNRAWAGALACVNTKNRLDRVRVVSNDNNNDNYYFYFTNCVAAVLYLYKTLYCITSTIRSETSVSSNEISAVARVLRP